MSPDRRWLLSPYQRPVSGASVSIWHAPQEQPRPPGTPCRRICCRSDAWGRRSKERQKALQSLRPSRSVLRHSARPTTERRPWSQPTIDGSERPQRAQVTGTKGPQTTTGTALRPPRGTLPAPSASTAGAATHEPTTRFPARTSGRQTARICCCTNPLATNDR